MIELSPAGLRCSHIYIQYPGRNFFLVATPRAHFEPKAEFLAGRKRIIGQWQRPNSRLGPRILLASVDARNYYNVMIWLMYMMLIYALVVYASS
jgi:hypothetical protein